MLVKALFVMPPLFFLFFASFLIAQKKRYRPAHDVLSGAGVLSLSSFLPLPFFPVIKSMRKQQEAA